ncbi:phospholipase C [Streptomyces fuscigenes]|uniref:phospholipase C n=1 Tax=Streptomyces fuscigenes TaxID=1528880 RepID=UPI001F390F3D|nr:alkaline phosphatase family protein [Streptomyces fuscigenes]MCF3962592.1 alkaline phosphatase family protein [Streptomyces fuscigenes]
MGWTGRTARARRWGAWLGAAALATLATGGSAQAAPAGHGGGSATPVKHLVVLFDENISFDRYFATYPQAANTDGTHFAPSHRTPRGIDNLRTAGLLTKNPNQYPPKRLGPDQAVTCDQRHDYDREQYAYNNGKADMFVQNTDSGRCSGNLYYEPGLVMDYYDGNTVTALWNYAQHYALNDNSFGSAYGPSTPGAIELVSGQTHGVVSTDPAASTEHPRRTAKPDPAAVASPDAHGVGTLINDPDPAFDDCSNSDHTSKSSLAMLTGKNIGDRLNEKGVSWGWFQGGFRPSTPWDGDPAHHAGCTGTTHANVGGASSVDYSPHHDPFQYYGSTANPHHLAPRSLAEIGHDGRANHNYDLTDFDAVLRAGKLPAVSFLKAPSYQDGHAGYSDPIDEQHFLVGQINAIQQSPQWKDTAVVIAYDDSDGWYDHVASPVLNGSTDSTPSSTGKPTDSPMCQSGPPAAGGYKDRCGPGARQPLMVISPYSKVNHIDHTRTEQASITRFIEQNWGTRDIGDHSFDRRAGSLASMFDFRHPNDKQLVLNTDGSVRSLGPVRAVAPVATSIAGLRQQNAALRMTAPGGGHLPWLAVSLGGALVVGAVAAVALRRRSTAGG